MNGSLIFSDSWLHNAKKKPQNQHITDLNYNENNLFTMELYLHET